MLNEISECDAMALSTRRHPSQDSTDRPIWCTFSEGMVESYFSLFLFFVAYMHLSIVVWGTVVSGVVSSYYLNENISKRSSMF